MEDLTFEILRLVEREGPKTTQQITEALGKTRYWVEIRLLRLKPRIRELQSKVHGPSIWWIPSVYEYMLVVAELRLRELGLEPIIKPVNHPALDFYGEGEKEELVGICTSQRDKEKLEEEFSKHEGRRVLLTDSPPEWEIEGVEVWTLSDVPVAGQVLIPVDAKVAKRLQEKWDSRERYDEFCSKMMRKGFEAKQWGL